MAFGFVKVIPASSHTELALSGSGGGNQYPSIKVLNPNDGVIYIARNRDCLAVDYGAWDWKVPSQSYAMLPGPFVTAGLFYLDQSGAGRQGEITVYPSQQNIEEPMFLAIGRALQAQATTLDVVEGTIPANPGAGIARIWVDTNDVLHVENSTGVDASYIDTLTALGGVLSGTLPNPGMAAGAVAAGNLAAGAAASNVGALGGSLTGTLPNPGVANGAIGTAQIAGGAITQILYNGASDGSTHAISVAGNVLTLIPGMGFISPTMRGGRCIGLMSVVCQIASGAPATEIGFALSGTIQSGGSLPTWSQFGNQMPFVANATNQVFVCWIDMGSPAAQADNIYGYFATSGASTITFGAWFNSFTIIEFDR